MYGVRTTGGYYYARLYDTAANGVPVRGQYTRSNDQDFNLYNPNGYNTMVESAKTAYRVVAVILCDDYPFGDDCSPKHYG